MGQLLSWLLFIPPWLLLIPLKRRKMKKFLSVAFFTSLMGSTLFQAAHVWNWWTITDNLVFLTDISSFVYGLSPVTTILVFYFTYPKLWLYLGTNIVFDAIQAFVISPFVFEKAGLYSLVNINHFILFLLIFMQAPVIYIYQRFYDARSGPENS
ncbi:hypothetical protein CLHUN_07090 [Ruminiclostridium hungatei]|uniref:Uncharacterized protein n=1 Tax=Ruminiclostridium hungatei TaxID=48256 RepID=A0A1V4SR64_RUMHU|nr:hypothetical protein [Ruminiclostridium hungatei]OPX45771.1 hypothetical protein CLHUN_07090 [Ruminiclostridium hungatei]